MGYMWEKCSSVERVKYIDLTLGITYILLLTLVPYTYAQVNLEFTLIEESPTGTLVGNLFSYTSVNRDKQFNPNTEPAFQLLTQTNLFQLNETSGDLVTKTSLDREKLCPESPQSEFEGKRIADLKVGYFVQRTQWQEECHVELQVLHFRQRSAGSAVGSNLHRVIIIRVVILDINDNPPKWTENVIQLTIPEHTAIGTRFPIPPAFDPDCGLTNTTASYNLIDNSQPISSRSDRLSHVSDAIFVLDSEVNHNSGHVDTRPGNWLKTLSGCSRRQFNLYIRVTRDVDFDLQTTENNPELPFTLNSVHLRHVQLKLVAVDDGQPVALSGTVLINITITDINDHAPRFKTQNSGDNVNWKTSATDEDVVEIEENTPVGKSIYTARAIDLDEIDQDSLTFSLESTASAIVRAMFDVHPKKGDIIVIQSPDYEKHKSFVLPLSVTDGKHRSLMNLIVRILNRNDNAPSITIRPLISTRHNVNTERFVTRGYPNTRAITLYVTEHDPPGVFVATVSVTDGDDKGKEMINNPSVIGLSTGNPLPYPSATRRDGDEGFYRCQISHVGLALAPLFEGAQTQFKLLTAAVFDREQQAEHFATITCYDEGRPPLSSQVGIHIIVEDINDHPPVMKTGQIATYIKENEPAGTKIYTVEASDMDTGDNAKLGFNLIADNPDDFHIDPQTGVITSLRSFDREQQSQLNATVIVYDRADAVKTHANTDGQVKKDVPDRYTVRANLIVHVQDVNDCSPTFGSSLYQLTVPEDAKINHMVGQIQANDSDATDANNQVHYMIKHQTDNQIVQQFRVSSQGFIYVARGNLDREKVSSYNFYLVAVDSGVPPLSSTTQVHIYVTDVNDNAPTWVFPAYNNQAINVTVNEPVGYRLAQLNAIDPDEAENGEVTYRLVQINRIALREVFEMSPESIQLPRTSEPPPSHYPSKYNGSSPHVPMTGYRTVTNLFELDPGSGSIYIGRSMSLEDLGTVKLVVEASDRGEPPKFSHRVLQVNILRFVLHPTKHSNTDIKTLGSNERNQFRPGLLHSGGQYESDLIVIVIMVAVTLIISLALIIAILFLRCGLCPSRRMNHWGQVNSANCQRENGPNHHIEEVFRDSAKTEDIFLAGTDNYGNHTHISDDMLSRYRTSTNNDPMCRSYLSNQVMDPWSLSPKKEALNGYETFRCNHVCGTVMRVQSPQNYRQLDGCVGIGLATLKPTRQANQNVANRLAQTLPDKDVALLQPHDAPCSTFRASCSHLTAVSQQPMRLNSAKIEDEDSMDSGHGCSRTTENEPSSIHEEASPDKRRPNTHGPNFRVNTPQTVQTQRVVNRPSFDLTNVQTPVKQHMLRSRSGSIPIMLPNNIATSVQSAKSTAEMRDHCTSLTAIRTPDYQTCGRHSHLACPNDGHWTPTSPLLNDMVGATDDRIILLSSVDPLGYAKLIHPNQDDLDKECPTSQNDCSSYSTSFV